MSSRLKYTLDVLEAMRAHGYPANLTPALRAAMDMAYNNGLSAQQFVEHLQHTPEAA